MMNDIDKRNYKYIKSVQERREKGDKVKPLGGRLEAWTKHPCTGGFYISAQLYDDPNQRWHEGCPITTSLVVKYREGYAIVETMNTKYVLGESLEDALKENKDDG